MSILFCRIAFFSYSVWAGNVQEQGGGLAWIGNFDKRKQKFINEYMQMDISELNKCMK